LRRGAARRRARQARGCSAGNFDRAEDVRDDAVGRGAVEFGLGA
jgi:hypothetical protein